MMKWGIILAALAGFSAASPAAAQSHEDRTAVSELPGRFSAGWQRHDAHELAAMMSSDVDFVNVGAIWLHGADFELYHDRILSGRFRSSTITPLDTHVRFLRPDLALVRWSWRIDGEKLDSGADAPVRHGLMSLIAEKQGEQWLVVAAQNTNAGPVRAEADGIEAPIQVPRAP